MPYLGRVDMGEAILSDMGEIAESVLSELPKNFGGVSLDEYIVMPNHIHAIISINEISNAQTSSNDVPCSRGLINQTPTNWPLMTDKRQTLGKIIRHFKAKTSRLIHRRGHRLFGWQRNYYEHIVRNNHELDAIRLYIRLNPANWRMDELFEH
jgi:REP element-mobilizing transposase RayT